MNFNKNDSVKNVNGKIKLIIILVLTILLFLIVISGSKHQNVSQNQMNDVLSSTNEYQEKIAITSLKFNEKEIELDIKETKDVILEILPENANIDNLEICTSDNNIATIEKSSEKNFRNFENAENTNNTAIIENSVNSINTENTENVENLINAETIEGTVNKIILKIKPISEGECEAYAKSNEVISNKIKIKVIDKEKIEREKEEQKAKQEKVEQELKAKQEKEEQEQKAKQEKEEQEQKAKKEKEEQEQKTKQEKKTQEQKTNQKKQNTTTGAQINRSSSASNATSQKKQTSSSSNSNNSHGKLVYATPKGKRYHFDPDCGGKNSYQTTLDAAKARGLTPCNKCAK